MSGSCAFSGPKISRALRNTKNLGNFTRIWRLLRGLAPCEKALATTRRWNEKRIRREEKKEKNSGTGYETWLKITVVHILYSFVPWYFICRFFWKNVINPIFMTSFPFLKSSTSIERDFFFTVHLNSTGGFRSRETLPFLSTSIKFQNTYFSSMDDSEIKLMLCHVRSP